MKKIIILLALVIVFGVANIALAVEEPVQVETETEEVQEETITEETEAVVEEDACPCTWGEWYYDVKVTYFRSCECGAYEELDEQTYYHLGGQYENCNNGRHNWCEDADSRYCEICGHTEEL